MMEIAYSNCGDTVAIKLNNNNKWADVVILQDCRPCSAYLSIAFQIISEHLIYSNSNHIGASYLDKSKAYGSNVSIAVQIISEHRIYINPNRIYTSPNHIGASYLYKSKSYRSIVSIAVQIISVSIGPNHLRAELFEFLHLP